MTHSTPPHAPPRPRWLDVLIVSGAVAMLALVILVISQRNRTYVAPGDSDISLPIILKIADVTTAEDTPITVPVELYSPHNPVESLTLHSRSSNPDLLPDQNILIQGLSTNRTVTLTPISNQFGNVSVTLTLKTKTIDIEETFRLTVHPVNDPPTLDPISNVSSSFNPILIPRGAVWKYLDDGSDAGTEWRNPAFDDSKWASGPAVLGYGDNQKTQVGYGPRSNQKYITTYFRHPFTIADPSRYSTLSLSLQRDDGGVVYLNGNEIFRSGMPDGNIHHRTVAQSTTSDEGRFFSSTADPGLLTTGLNVVAVEIHQSSSSSSDISFNMDLFGDPKPNPSIEINLTGISPGADNESTDVISIKTTSSAPAVMTVASQTYSHSDTTATLTLIPGTPGKAEITVLVDDGQETNNTVQQTFTAYVSKPGT